MENVPAALDKAELSNWLLTQNESAKRMEAASEAREIGIDVAYSTAPLDVVVAVSLSPFLTSLIMNEIKAEQMACSSGMALENILAHL